MRCSIFATLFAFVQLAIGVPINTEEPEKGVEKEERQKRSDAVVEFLMDSESRQSLLHEENTLENILKPNKDDLNTNLVCPEKVSNDADGSANELSTCPWYYSVSHDPTRFPATLFNAEPLCEYAIGSNKAYECSPITQKMKVLRQQPSLDDSNKYVWVEDIVTIAIGFTASGRRIVSPAESSSSTTASPNRGTHTTPVWS